MKAVFGVAFRSAPQSVAPNGADHKLPRGIYKDCAPTELASPLEVSIRGLQEMLHNTSGTRGLHS